ncbi:MAG: hypothetical protein M1829_005016 [Trizodia sp. TS-e1964]|nr:MAG: hypothetical protein M1829_005016 [Trizodia sp. TS-e1964]
MLKSTHRPSATLPDIGALPPGWTEHKAPTGHTYFYNTETKQSTYSRPSATVSEQGSFLGGSAPYSPAQPLAFPNSQGFLPYNDYSIQAPGFPFRGQQAGGDRGRDSPSYHNRPAHNHRDRNQPRDRPKSKHEIPGCAPWLLVKTKLERRFVYNPVKNESFWKVPEELKQGIEEFDRQECGISKLEDDSQAEENIETAAKNATPEAVTTETEEKGPDAEAVENSDEYEEIEVTDDEDDPDQPRKRQRTGEEDEEETPHEFNEEDMAYQLAALGQDYGLDPGEYADAAGENWDEEAGGLPMTEEDTDALFMDMLDDLDISPYHTWEMLIEDSRMYDDTRYTVATTMKARKSIWERWAKKQILKLKDEREKMVKADPRIPYMAFLQEHGTLKLYWPEFKRKYKKEPEMRDSKLSDKDREKWYREHTNRLKLPQSTLKSDLSALLKSLPLSILNRSTLIAHLPSELLTDIRYISLSPAIRDPLVEAYISTLAPAPSDAQLSPEAEAEAAKARQDKERRQKALAEREKKVAAEKSRQESAIEYGRGRLREEERELERAMKVGKGGLKAHLAADLEDT